MIVSIQKMNNKIVITGSNFIRVVDDAEIICEQYKVRRKLAGLINELIVDAYIIVLRDDNKALIMANCG